MDTNNNRIRSYNMTDGSVNTIAGNGSSADVDGPGIIASFKHPTSCDINLNVMYFTTLNGLKLLNFTTGQVKTVAGNGVAGNHVGPPLISRLNGAGSIRYSGTGSIYYLTDPGNSLVRQFDSSTNTISTLAGSTPGASE